MMTRPFLHAALVVLVSGAAPHGAAAAQGFEELLDKLSKGAETAVIATPVVVIAAVEANRAGERVLVVTLAARPEFKLVADPGITVTPLPRDGLAWSAAGPASRVTPGGDSFNAPQSLRLPFTSSTPGPVQAKVDYAYCRVGQQCLFGEETVSVDTGGLPAR